MCSIHRCLAGSRIACRSGTVQRVGARPIVPGLARGVHRTRQGWSHITRALKGHLVLVAPHDPIPLLAQIEQRWPGVFQEDYLERGPVAWRLCFVRRDVT